MKNFIKTVCVILILFSFNCNSPTDPVAINKEVKKDNVVGKVEIYDNNALKSIDSNATIEVIASGFNWAEGPLWLPDKQELIFSDVPENKIYEWKQGDTASVYLTHSGYTGTVARAGENGSNGLALDIKGRLLLCQSGNRQIAAMKTSTGKPMADYTILAATYHGKKFNSPNDLVADSKNNIYFTDPTYGLPAGDTDKERVMSFEGVFKISTDGKTTLLIDSIPKPNGIALSLDEKILYIASSDANKPAWYAYNLDAQGNVISGKQLLDAVPLKEKAAVKQGPDGFKIDNYGNLFCAGPDGINIISPEGHRLGLIKVYGRKTSNCAFNETKDILYITAKNLVLKVVLHH